VAIMAALEVDKEKLCKLPVLKQKFLLTVMSSISLTENMMSIPQRGLTKKERARKEREQYGEEEPVDSDFEKDDKVRIVHIFKYF